MLKQSNTKNDGWGGADTNDDIAVGEIDSDGGPRNSPGETRHFWLKTASEKIYK